jgi:predicted nuclease of predicted toxin-antitoxin system
MAGFYANENLSAAMVNELRRLGHDVLTSYEAGNANLGIPDDRVLATATANDRCVITFNRKDFVDLHRMGSEHRGIIVCKDNPDHILQVLVIHDLLSKQQTLQNRLFRVLKQNQRGSSQPLFIVQEYLRL